MELVFLPTSISSPGHCSSLGRKDVLTPLAFSGKIEDAGIGMHRNKNLGNHTHLIDISPESHLKISQFLGIYYTWETLRTICFFQCKYHDLFYINNHHWSLELLYYVKIQKNEYSREKSQCHLNASFWWVSGGFLCSFECGCRGCSLPLEFLWPRPLVTWSSTHWAVNRFRRSLKATQKKVRDPFSRMEFLICP